MRYKGTYLGERCKSGLQTHSWDRQFLMILPPNISSNAYLIPLKTPPIKPCFIYFDIAKPFFCLPVKHHLFNILIPLPSLPFIPIPHHTYIYIFFYLDFIYIYITELLQWLWMTLLTIHRAKIYCKCLIVSDIFLLAIP